MAMHVLNLIRLRGLGGGGVWVILGGDLKFWPVKKGGVLE